jgi:hypothetical protein
MSKPTQAYELEPGQLVGCMLCMQDNKHTAYRRGEAFLVEQGVLGDDAHYVCKRHLDDLKPFEITDSYQMVAKGNLKVTKKRLEKFIGRHCFFLLPGDRNQRCDYPRFKRGTIERFEGRNIVIGDNYYWMPDITEMWVS